MAEPDKRFDCAEYRRSLGEPGTCRICERPGAAPTKHNDLVDHFNATRFIATHVAGGASPTGDRGR